MPHMLDLDTPIRIHLVGAGGAGMSALAKLLWAKGHIVSGSDLRMASIMANLSDLGMEVWEGSRPEVMAACDLVVASSAVPEAVIGNSRRPAKQASLSGSDQSCSRP